MPQAEKLNTTNRRTLLATLAAAVPAVIVGAPIAAAALADQPTPAKPEMSFKDGHDWLAEVMLSVPIAAVAQNDSHVVYSVRVPLEALLGRYPYPCPAMANEKFQADIVAYVAARIRELTVPAALA